jgi:hypothetical protein
LTSGASLTRRAGRARRARGTPGHGRGRSRTPPASIGLRTRRVLRRVPHGAPRGGRADGLGMISRARGHTPASPAARAARAAGARSAPPARSAHPGAGPDHRGIDWHNTARLPIRPPPVERPRRGDALVKECSRAPRGRPAHHLRRSRGGPAPGPER